MNKGEATKSVYILLTDCGTLLTKTIKQYTAAPYNHVSLSLDIELNELYSFGRKVPRNPLYGGFVKEDVYCGTYRYFPNTKCVVFKLRVTDDQWARIKQVIRFFRETEHLYSYNLIGLFGIVVNHPVELRNAYFCTQFVAEVLKRSGVQLWDKPSALVTPNDFLQHPAFQTIYEGKLYDYPLLQVEKLLLFQPQAVRHPYIQFPYRKIRRVLTRTKLSAFFSMFG